MFLRSPTDTTEVPADGDEGDVETLIDSEIDVVPDRRSIGQIDWLLAPGDRDLANLIASASLINRIFIWLLPIVVGLIPLANWRRSDRGQADEGSHTAVLAT